MSTLELTLSPDSLEDYQKFLRIKSLPQYRFVGRTAYFPSEYSSIVNGRASKLALEVDYEPSSWAFDYQRDITRLAIHRRKFAVFADCGLGKTTIIFEYAKHVQKVLPKNRRTLIVSPLMVVSQTLGEAVKFYGDSLPIERVSARNLPAWLASDGGGIGITNYDALTDDIPQGNLGALILDESSMLKSAYGKWAQTCLRLGMGLDWKLALTGTPAPNDRIEYANHAVFLDHFPTVNSFLARFFVNRGQTQNRWELKPHALRPFYRALSHWSIFLTNPATYGWKDNCGNIPPIHVHIHEVELTGQQRDLVFSETGNLFAADLGGITTRSKLSQIAKGHYRAQIVDTRKNEYIRDKLLATWPDESTLIWCLYNAEQETLAKFLPHAISLTGDTPLHKRQELIEQFKSGAKKELISKSKILGFGLNLQKATRQVFSGLQDSFEMFYQCVKRSNRIGSTRPLNVHIPVTEIERPMLDTVLRKKDRVQADTEEQEQLFREASKDVFNVA